MKVQKHAISLACLAALGFAGSAQAVQVAGETLEIFGNMYPQYQMTTSADGKGTTGATSSLVPAAIANTAAPAAKTQVNWVNSYIGLKGQKSFGDVRAGFESQAVLMKNGTSSTESNDLGEARDSYVFIAHKNLGTLQMGQMDTILKEFGDRVRLLGVSSSNFVATSNVMLGPTWRTQKDSSTSPVNSNTAGVVTFNTRINGQLRWISPNFNGVEVGVSYRPDPSKSSTSDASLQAYGIRWSNQQYYVGLATEVHNDYRAFSGNVSGTTPSTFIYNLAAVRSKDTATRLTFGYTADKYRIGADVASLKYTEDGASGKFESYDTTTWQITGEYNITQQITVGANYASGAAGNCTLVGGATCSTNGLGGSLFSLGARYDYDKNIGLFALYGLNTVGDNASLASGATGGNVTNVAIGLQVKF